MLSQKLAGSHLLCGALPGLMAAAARAVTLCARNSHIHAVNLQMDAAYGRRCDPEAGWDLEFAPEELPRKDAAVDKVTAKPTDTRALQMQRCKQCWGLVCMAKRSAPQAGLWVNLVACMPAGPQWKCKSATCIELACEVALPPSAVQEIGH